MKCILGRSICLGGIMKKVISLSMILTLSSTLAMANVTIPELATAIQVGDEIKVNQYLAEGGNPNATLVQGQTLVFASVGAMNNKALQQFINAGADVNKGGSIGGRPAMSPLMLAVSVSNNDAVKLLVDAGGDVNTKYMGISARQMAKNIGNQDALVLLTPSDIKPVDAGSTYINTKVDSAKTILSQLSAADQIKAKQEAKKGEHLSYPLYEKGKGFFTGLAETMIFGVEKGRIRLNLITPYSLYRHGYYEEVQTFTPFTDEAKTEILANKDKVYIVPWSETYGVIPSYIKNLVIRKNGKIYHAQEVSTNYLMRLGVSSTYAFDINLFDGEPMEIIAIDASNDKQLVMPIDRKFYEKRGWY